MSGENENTFIDKLKEFLSRKPVRYTLYAVLGISVAGLLIGGVTTGTITGIVTYIAEIVSKLG